MPAAKSIAIRQEIVERRERGETFVAIAEALALPYPTVRNIWRHWQVNQRLTPNYEACSKRGPRKGQALWEAAVGLKRAHPRWGAVVIHEHLKGRFAEASLPSVRTLQLWFRQAGVNRSASVRHSGEPVKRGQAVHEVWAVDAKELIPLASGERVSWLTVTDEGSGAILSGQIFSPGQVGESGAAPSAGPSATTL